ncbi:MAG: hypothetical protein QXD51_04640 [Candidatus Anstonellales archaeon]
MMPLTSLEKRIAVTKFTIEYLRGRTPFENPKRGVAFLRAADVLEENLIKMNERYNFIRPLVLNQQLNAMRIQ